MLSESSMSAFLKVIIKSTPYLILCCRIRKKMIDRYLWLPNCIAEGQQVMLLIKMDRL